MQLDWTRRTNLRLVLGAVAALILATSAHSQDQSTKQQQGISHDSQTGNAPTNSDQSNSDTGNQSSDSTEVPPAFQVTKIGSAQWLEPSVHSPLHLGPVYVGSVSASFLASDAAQFNAVQNQAVSQINYFGLLEADVTYDKLTSVGRLTFQYAPQVVISDGVVQPNFSNQSLTFAVSHALSPRWTLGLSNSLRYLNGQVLYGNLSLDVNPVSGGTFQNPFLQTTERWLSDSTVLSLGYEWSSRDQLNFTASYQYLNSNLATLPQTSNSYGGSVNWNHLLSQTKSVGLYIQLQENQYSTAFPATLYKGFGANFSDQLSATWVLQAAAGASIGNAGSGPGQNSQDNWTATGNVTLRKDFQSSTFALGAFRGITSGPFLTNGYTNRVDATYSRRLTRRVQASVGAAYERDSFSGGRISGTYASAQLRYLLSRNFSCFGAYARLWQNQPQTILGSGQLPANTFSTGLSWNLARGSGGVISPLIY